MKPTRLTPSQPAAAALVLVVLSAFTFGITPGFALEKTLQNDGFTGVGDLICIPGFDVGEIGAARFTADPQDYPFTVERVQLILCPDGPATSLVIKVWEDDGMSLTPGNLLHEDIYTLTPSTVFMNDVDLSPLGIVIDSASVRVGVEFFFFPSPPGLARDTDGINPQTNFVYANPGVWQYAESLGVVGDWIIRLVIETDVENALFSDGFESGDTSAWSTVAP